ncbi:MAG TPA: 2-dehydropantoate 2-reductase N-terminal domain-containing protein, partial [Steroidobacteraceae bacterium]|nr:2-dehydropantoate 2-reductase N-terminal domain-containing protein [Steroidobacteraceae bacterium]
MSDVTGSGSPVAVLGAGSWGTALAIQFARSGRPTRLWGRDRARLAVMARDRRNARYLAAGAFPPSLAVVPELTEALRGARDVLIALPSHAFRPMLDAIAPLITPDMRL